MDAFELAHQWTSRPPISSAVVASVDRTPVFQQAADASGIKWKFNLTLNEEAGIGTTLTDFLMDGVSYASQIKTLFGSASIAPRGIHLGRAGAEGPGGSKERGLPLLGCGCNRADLDHRLFRSLQRTAGARLHPAG